MKVVMQIIVGNGETTKFWIDNVFKKEQLLRSLLINLIRRAVKQ